MGLDVKWNLSQLADNVMAQGSLSLGPPGPHSVYVMSMPLEECESYFLHSTGWVTVTTGHSGRPKRRYPVQDTRGPKVQRFSVYRAYFMTWVGGGGGGGRNVL